MLKIKEKVASVFKNKAGQVFTAEEIKHLVKKTFPGTNPNSIIPSDYCYNMINKDPSSFKLRIFHCIEKNVYICLAENVKYIGPVYWKEKEVGRWIGGNLDLWDDPRV